MADIIKQRTTKQVQRTVKKHIEVMTVPAQAVQTVVKRIRVGAYCRVSTDSEEQLYSLENQMNAFKHQIDLHPDWELVEIYVDEGISGTSVKKRQGFQKMIKACEAGEIDYIITKSISRFARNTTDCLLYVRKLQALGVQLYFEKEGIDTSDSYSEMLLTIMAAFAQEESRSISENVKWSMRKRFENGQETPMPLYGYKHTENEMYQIVPAEAKIVREIFDRYVHGDTATEIANDLKERQVPPPFRTTWNGRYILKMLRNIKYIGDVILQRNYIVDHLTHKEVKNHGEIPIYHVYNAHPALIDKCTYEQVQKIMQLHSVQHGNCKYPYNTMLKCPLCGETLVHGSLDGMQFGKNTKNPGGAWGCYGENGCRQYMIIQRLLDQVMLKAYNMKHDDPVDRVDYYWLDDKVDTIQMNMDDSVTIIWKDGDRTTWSLIIRYPELRPINSAIKYNEYLKAYETRKKRKKYMMGFNAEGATESA